MLLGRLHHRNLVNLVGYCAEKGQHMLIYVYMSRGSLASHLYGMLLRTLFDYFCGKRKRFLREAVLIKGFSCNILTLKNISLIA